MTDGQENRRKRGATPSRDGESATVAAMLHVANGGEMTETQKSAEFLIPEYLLKQFTRFVDAQFQAYAERSDRGKTELLEKYRRWFQRFGEDFFQTRYQRGREISSPKIERARTLAAEFIGEDNHDFFCTCLDGRNIPVLFFSKVPGLGGALRSAAAKIDGLMRGIKKNQVTYLRNSPTVQQIEKLILERPDGVIYYGLDSHFGCAARDILYTELGGTCKDHGLLSDIQEKMTTARAILALRQELAQEGKRAGKKVAVVVPTFFSFNPSNGYVSMGLEANVDDERVQREGFTFKDPHATHGNNEQKLLDTLAHEQKIVRAEDLIQADVIQRALQSVSAFVRAGSADFRENYPDALLNNWEAITRIYDGGGSEAFQYIVTRLEKAYGESGWVVGEVDDFTQKQISVTTLRQKAKFLLKNIVTRYSIAGTDPKWPYDTHIEVAGVITDGGYGPFPKNRRGKKFDAFSISAKALSRLKEDVRLAAGLIRKFREAGSAENPYPEILDEKEYPNAPIMFLNKAILNIKNEHGDQDEETWELLQSLDLSQVFKDIDWSQKTPSDFTEETVNAMLLAGIPNILSLKINVIHWGAFVKAVQDLLQRMAILTKDNLYEIELNGGIAVANTIVDKKRKPRLVLPITV